MGFLNSSNASEADYWLGNFTKGSVADLIQYIELGNKFGRTSGSSLYSHPENCEPDEIEYHKNNGNPYVTDGKQSYSVKSGKRWDGTFSSKYHESMSDCSSPDMCYDGSDATPLPTGSMGDRIAAAAWNTAGKCIKTTDSFRAKYGQSKKETCNRWESGWACYRGVKQALQSAGAVKGYLSGTHAVNAHFNGTLKRAGFKDSACNPRNAPNGAVLVYNGDNTSGHIEIKVIRNGNTYYCSDYCATKPRNEAHPKRPFEACYVK